MIRHRLLVLAGDMLLLIVLLCTLSAKAAVRNDTLVVKTGQGVVRGFREANSNYVAFYGIPYATTPLGNDRFKAPLPPTQWTGVLNATTRNVVCPQRIRRNEKLFYKEDCLLLDIFLPLGVPNNRKLPVLVYIHGGSFIHSGDRGDPKNLIRHDIIVVTFEYRLGVLGFLCLGTRDAPGNAGLKDQIAALKWVKENIGNFGGNPHNITLYGSSAGAASIDILILANKGNLFSRAISESGSVFSRDFDIDGRKRALHIARKMGYRGVNDPKDILDFLRNAPILDLGTVEMADFNITDRMGPCIETIESDTSIITEHPLTLSKKGNYHKIPHIMGIGNLEGISFTSLFPILKGQLISNTSNPISPLDLILDKREQIKLLDNIRRTYFGNEEIRMDERFIKLCSEMYAEYPLLASAMHHACNSSAPIYLFQFIYDGSLGLPREDFKYLKGARHGDFWAYIFSHGVNSSKTEDVVTLDRLTSLVANFAKYGDPTPFTTQVLPVKWIPVSGKGAQYLEIGTALTMQPDLRSARFHLLDEVYGYGVSAADSPHIKSTCLSFVAFLIAMCTYNVLF